MRTPTAFSILMGVLASVTASAQGSGAGDDMDFSGVYAVGTIAGVATVQPDPYPFTEQGERAHNAYDPLVSDIRQTDDCAKDPFPEILWSGNPIEISQEDGRIMLRYEDADTRRSIVMNGSGPSPDQPRAGLGYSAGHWDGDVLTIVTTHLTSRFIVSNRGYPISPDARITERYRREPGANDLRLDIEVDDPVNYTETFTLSRRFLWAPDERVRPWECVSLGPRDSETTDIDDLARMLEEL